VVFPAPRKPDRTKTGSFLARSPSAGPVHRLTPSASGLEVARSDFTET